MTQKAGSAGPSITDCLSGTPGQRLEQIRDFFRCRGLLGKSLELNLEDRAYRLVCDDRALAVFRVNHNQGLPPGNPGWMVCRLDNDSLFEECETEGLSQCKLACYQGLREWLELVDKEYS
jgi:hypothetical protein